MSDDKCHLPSSQNSNKLEGERDGGLLEKTEQNENEKRLDRETKAQNEDIEHALGFRPEGKGAMVGFCPSNMSDDEI